jgi:hypothetical protein
MLEIVLIENAAIVLRILKRPFILGGPLLNAHRRCGTTTYRKFRRTPE